jgi:hypothetical protein
MAISDDDLDTCFSTDDFAVEGIFETSEGSVTVNGYFTDATDAVTINDTRIEATEPTFQCRTTEIEDVRQGDTLTIDDTEYEVKRIQRVGIGVSVCYLKS